MHEPRPKAPKMTPKMTTRARAVAITVEDLLERVREGRIRMPNFQRGLKWDGNDRRALADSVYRGYPIGTVLLWKNPPSTAGGRGLRGVEDPSESGDRFLVVDGQQRITTLWEALGRRPDVDERTLVFSVEDDAFRYRTLRAEERDGKPAVAPDGRAPDVPLYVVLDATALSEWVPAELPRETKRAYFDLGKQLREYQLPLYEVDGADEETLRHVFDRVNTSGRPMQRDEVFNALVGSKIGEGRDLAWSTRATVERGFGAIKAGTLLNALEAIDGTRVGGLDPHTFSVQAAAIAVQALRPALGAVAQFLQANGVPHASLCAYELPLIVLARFWALFPRPSDRSRRLLARWYWRGAVDERHGSASNAVQRHLDEIRDGDEEGSVARLLTHASEVPERNARPSSGAFSLNGARGKVHACALLHQRPRDLRTGEVLTLDDLFGGEGERDGATGLLQRVVPQTRDAGSESWFPSLATKLIHPPVRNWRVAIGEADVGALASHGIDEAARDSLLRGDAEAFVARRAAVLEGWVAAFVDARTERERDDAPSIAHLARGGGGR